MGGLPAVYGKYPQIMESGRADLSNIGVPVVMFHTVHQGFKIWDALSVIVLGSDGFQICLHIGIIHVGRQGIKRLLIQRRHIEGVVLHSRVIKKL